MMTGIQIFCWIAGVALIALFSGLGIAAGVGLGLLAISARGGTTLSRVF